MQRITFVLDNIRKLRESRQFTQAYLGHCLGIGQNGYSKIELGLTKITIANLLEIAYVFNVNPEQLLKAPKEKGKHLRSHLLN